MEKEYHGYSVDSRGFIWNKKHTAPLSQTSKNKDGYIKHVLVDNGERYHITAHRVIATMFIPNPDNLPVVNHLNGIKDDNRVENLEWTTVSGNTQHAFDNGLAIPNITAKHTIVLNMETGEKNEFESRKEAEKYFKTELRHFNGGSRPLKKYSHLKVVM